MKKICLFLLSLSIASHPVIKGEALTETARTATPKHIVSIISMEDQHTAEEVPVMAAGPGAEMIHGWTSNTDTFHYMMRAFGWESSAVQVKK